ncbi:eCIS core domain-containing protein [Microscilla marina]|nr:DUF4157 domain-containing protein [Microscilla marina]
MTMQQSGHKSANESDNGNPTQLKTQKTLGKPQSIKTSSPYQPIPSRTGQQPPIQSKQSKLGGPIPSKQGKLGPIKAKQRPIQRAEKGKPSSQGSSTETQLKHNVSQLMGVDVTDTQVHYNSDKPTQLKAEAFAQGNEVHLAPGKERHLGHELAHIGQQKQGRVKPTLQMKGGTSINDDPQLEQEADKIGDKALQMKPQQGETLPLPQTRTPSGNNAPVQRVVKTKDGKKHGTEVINKYLLDSHTIELLLDRRTFVCNTSLQQLNDEPTNNHILLLRPDYYYLIGETHTESPQSKITQHFKNTVPLLYEHHAPHHSDPKFDKSNQGQPPLENTIARASFVPHTFDKIVDHAMILLTLPSEGHKPIDKYIKGLFTSESFLKNLNILKDYLLKYPTATSPEMNTNVQSTAIDSTQSQYLNALQEAIALTQTITKVLSLSDEKKRIRQGEILGSTKVDKKLKYKILQQLSTYVMQKNNPGYAKKALQKKDKLQQANHYRELYMLENIQRFGAKPSIALMGSIHAQNIEKHLGGFEQALAKGYMVNHYFENFEEMVALPQVFKDMDLKFKGQHLTLKRQEVQSGFDFSTDITDKDIPRDEVYYKQYIKHLEKESGFDFSTDITSRDL